MVEFKAASQEAFDFCPGGILGAMKTVIALEKLASLSPYQADFSEKALNEMCPEKVCVIL